MHNDNGHCNKPGFSVSHGGDYLAISTASGLSQDDIIDASANLNPLGPPAWLDAAFMLGKKHSVRYPDPAYRELRAKASLALAVPEDTIVFSNGADELMFALARLLAKNYACKSAIVEDASYATYKDASVSAGLEILTIKAGLPEPVFSEKQDSPRSSSEAFFARVSDVLKNCSGPALLWIGTPNNPTGLMPEGWPEVILQIAQSFSRHFIAVDEAFLDFVIAPEGCNKNGLSINREAQSQTYLIKEKLKNLIIIRSMTKFWAIPGLRLGYALCYDKLASELRQELPNWPVNSVAEAVAGYAFSDPTAKLRVDQTKAFVKKERERMAKELAKIKGLIPLNSYTNYYLLKVEREAEPAISSYINLTKANIKNISNRLGSVLADLLAIKGIGLRKCENFSGLGPEYLRIAVRSEEENNAILNAIIDIFESKKKPVSAQYLKGPKNKRRAKAIMIQGCSSSAGKSIISTAFCRIFKEKGLSVAPYKAQNMSGISVKFGDGLEISMAQAIQARAAGLDYDVRMNPVLLKPSGAQGSSVYLLGKHYGNLSAKDYYSINSKVKETARQAYDELASQYDIIVLEGAGSPAEINLKQNDVVNMSAAIYANAKVLLVGDIDRGGVFASFIGHTVCFTPEELKLFLGFLVNKFRGDPSLLGNAFDLTKERTGYPVLGCIPMINNLDIPEEDTGLFMKHELHNTSTKADKPDEEFTRLASIVRANVNLNSILAALGL